MVFDRMGQKRQPFTGGACGKQHGNSLGRLPFRTSSGAYGVWEQIQSAALGGSNTANQSIINIINMARKSVKISRTPTKAEALELVKQHSEAVHKLEILRTKMDGELDKIRKKYTDQMAALQTAANESFASIQQYAMEVRDDEFATKKSQDWGVAVVGFRIGAPATKLRKGFTWASVMTLLKEKDLRQFLRVKDEVNKELMLEYREDDQMADQLSQCGVVFDQSEAFYIDVKQEEAITA